MGGGGIHTHDKTLSANVADQRPRYVMKVSLLHLPLLSGTDSLFFDTDLPR